MKNKLIVIRKTLKANGINDPENLQDYYLINKHVDRYIILISFIKKYKLEQDAFTLSSLYRADVVIRQEIMKVLFPIELSLSSKLSYWLEINNVKLEDLFNGKFLEDFSILDINLKNKRLTNLLFVQKTLLFLSKKFRDLSFHQLPSKMMFGQLVAFISVLSNEASLFIFKKNKSEIINSLMYIKEIRNYIAHLEMLFTSKKIQIGKNKRQHITLEELIEHIGNIAYGNYEVKFAEAIKKYRTNVIKKYACDSTEINKLEAIFKAIFLSFDIL